MSKRRHVDDLRGLGRLAVAAAEEVTTAVEAMHREIASGPNALGQPLALPARALTRLVYGSVRRFTQIIGASLDLALAELGPLFGEGAPGREREIARAVLNGVLGDYLEASANPLAIAMALRVAVPARQLIVMVHGSCSTDTMWRRNGHDHGELLARAKGWGLAYLHYNSGLHISQNGAQLSAALAALVAAHDTESLIVIGHSMGGLVARSACHVGRGEEWCKKLEALVCLGSPHHGAPLERGGQWLHTLIGVSRYSAPVAQLLRVRSAGVTDLRYGNVRDEDWGGRDRFALSGDPRVPLPLPHGVRCYAIAGTTSKASSARLASDGLVPVASALGRHPDEARALKFASDRQAIMFETGHLDLLDSPEVYAMLASWLA